ncbi:hypothetical protein ABI_37210 [Asticcacaulis biprosthecium C19]|uniref:Uncharacterized protein n=1 Tax=Asticcacaulis biprosthecium C19 TaxID=715226 RepID=F4QR53_9CAUL|nr:hypothetical protein ABI_37210 [Asticcacaulis biprosthecium C19]
MHTRTKSTSDCREKSSLSPEIAIALVFRIAAAMTISNAC